MMDLGIQERCVKHDDENGECKWNSGLWIMFASGKVF